MTEVIRIPLFALLGRELLAGRQSAEHDLPKLEAKLVDARPTVVLDFNSIADVTPSYFAGMFLPFCSVTEGPLVFPVLANLAPDCRHAVVTSLRAARATVWGGTWNEGLTDTAPIGMDLDRPFADTLDKLRLRSGPTTAADLYASDNSVIPTAWSNRLATLHQMRLLRRAKDGRRAVFSFPWEVSHG